MKKITKNLADETETFLQSNSCKTCPCKWIKI